MTSTARVIEPSGPRSASPGPMIDSCIALTTHMISQSIASVVVATQKTCSASGTSSTPSTWPTSTIAVKAKPERSAASVPTV